MNPRKVELTSKVSWLDEIEKGNIEIAWLPPWDLPNTPVVEGAILSSGRIVVMTDQDSYWFESDGTSPKGTFLLKVKAGDDDEE